MHDYEYMLVAIDEVISHEVAGIICMENYKNCYFPNGFKKVFDMFCEFQEEYETSKQDFQKEKCQEMEFIKFQSQCRSRKEELLKNFVAELQGIDSSINFIAEVHKYKETLEQQDVQTADMNLSIYPLLISLIREREEKA